jgi:hypothetical protein
MWGDPVILWKQNEDMAEVRGIRVYFRIVWSFRRRPSWQVVTEPSSA